MPVVKNVHAILRMPLHELELRVVAIVMLVRNLNLKNAVGQEYRL
jgi:hypothetical protein